MKYTYVGVVLVRGDGAVLVQHRDNIPTIAAPNKWSICGGRREPEDLDDKSAARREIVEETGYKLETDELHELASDEFRIGDRDIHRKFYWAYYDGRQEINCYEGQEIKFISTSDLKKLDFCDQFHVKYLEMASETSRRQKIEGNKWMRR